MNSDFSVLIQGPQKADSDCRDYIKFYKKIGIMRNAVVVSCYDGDSTEKIENDKDTLIIKSPLPDLESKQGVLKDSTFYYALYTTYQGLKKVKTKYTIKVRSDEGYENLQPLISEFLRDDNKLVCGNIFYKPWGKFTHHMGDHIFVAKTSVLIQAYKFLLDMYDGKRKLQPDFVQFEYCAEAILCKAILYFLEDRLIYENIPRYPCYFADLNKNLLISYDNKIIFETKVLKVDINKMKNYICKWAHKKIVYRNNFREVL